MNEQAAIAEDLRARILEEPGVILEDPDVMRALISANEMERGENVVDLRGVAMDRLESRLQRLEDTHRSVIAAAYENLAGTTIIHRAILTFLEPATFQGFLACLARDLPEVLRVGRVRLVLESHESEIRNEQEGKLTPALTVVPAGFIEHYLGRGQNMRQVTLRRSNENAPLVYGKDADWVQSEACLMLDFGKSRLPGMLCLASDSAMHFTPNQGTELLSFMGGVFERSMRRWLG